MAPQDNQQRAHVAGQVAAAIGLGIERVSITGHHMTPDAAIFDALDAANPQSLAALDRRAACARIERLPWVATCDMRHRFPNALDIRVTERRPLAVWRLGGEDHLIDRAGQVLSPVQRGRVAHLPLVAGEGAGVDAQRLLVLLARHPGLTQRVRIAERAAGRRWTLHLGDGLVLLLPAEREAAALDALSRPGLDLLLSRQDLVIDLRVRGRVSVRPARQDTSS